MNILFYGMAAQDRNLAYKDDPLVVKLVLTE